jgi:hypothetical protein
MTRWIVGTIPAGVLLIGFVAVVVGGAVLVQTYVRHRFPALTRDDHNDAARFTYGVIGFVYAFLIGFVVNSMWSQTSAADSDARQEGATAVQMARDLTVFEDADSGRIRAALLAYEQAAIGEWKDAWVGRSPAADSALTTLYAAYEQVRPTTDVSRAFLTSSLANLETISQARTERLLQAQDNSGLPWPMWALIFLTSGLVLGTVVVYGVEKPAMHYPMVAVVGILIATNLFIVVELSHPFIGPIATSPDPLHAAVAVLEQR